MNNPTYFFYLFFLLLPFSINAQTASDKVKNKELKEVVITAQTVETHGNETTYKITRQMREGKISTNELIGALPGFFYEPTKRTFLYNNSNNYVVLIDGIEKPADMVLNLRHLRFDRVKITDNPQGKYLGYNVLIELFTKKDYEGYEGYIFSNANLTINDTENKKFNYVGSDGMFTFTKNKFTLMANLGHNWNGKSYNDGYFFKRYTFMDMTEEKVPNRNGAADDRQNSATGYGYVSADYMFNEKSSMSIVYSPNINHNRTEETSTILRTTTDEEDEFVQDSRTHTNNNSHIVGVFYRNDMYRIKFNVDFNYRLSSQLSSNSLTEPDANLTNDFNYRLNLTEVRITGNTDIGKNRNFNIDFGYINTWKETVMRDDKTDRQLSKNSHLRNRVFGGIKGRVNLFEFSLNPWIDIIRVKNGNTHETQIPWGVSALAFYRFTQRNWIRINYSCSISHPVFTQLGDWGYFTGPFNWQEGNPFLKSSVIHSLSSWVDLWNCFNFQCGTTIIPDKIANIYTMRTGIRPDGSTGPYTVCNPQNTRSTSVWASASVTKRLGKGFTLKGDIRHEYSSASFEEFRNHGDKFNFLTGLYYYNSKYAFNLSVKYGICRQTQVDPQRKFRYNYETPDIAFEKRFINGRFSVAASWENMFNLFKHNICQVITVYPGYDGFQNHVWSASLKNRFSLTLTYRFNGGKSVRRYNSNLTSEN